MTKLTTATMNFKQIRPKLKIMNWELKNKANFSNHRLKWRRAKQTPDYAYFSHHEFYDTKANI